jgi:hypothetical protein
LKALTNGAESSQQGQVGGTHSQPNYTDPLLPERHKSAHPFQPACQDTPHEKKAQILEINKELNNLCEEYSQL